MRIFLTACAFAALLSCSPPAQQQTETAAPPAAGEARPVATEVPAGAYTLDKAHSTLLFRVNHIGFSHYTGRFDNWDAELTLDPADPAASSVTARVNPRSLAVPNPPPGFLNDLKGPQWLNTAQFPEMTFRSTSVALTGPNTARITGDFTMHGVTKPVTLDATFNGGYAGHPMDPHARVGMSAHGTLKRSEFGISIGVPPPGSTMGVGDDVEIIIESEFNGPAWTPPPQQQAPQQQEQK